MGEVDGSGFGGVTKVVGDWCSGMEVGGEEREGAEGGGGVTETAVVTAVVTVDDCVITTAVVTLDGCGIVDARDEAGSDTSTDPSPFWSLFSWMTVM